MKRWPLHVLLLAIAAATAGVASWADLARLAPLNIPPGILTALAWYFFAFYAVITTVLTARAKDAARTVAAHVIGAVTAPAAAYLLAGVVFGIYKGVEHAHH